MAKKEKAIDRAQKFIQKGYLDKAIEEYRAITAMDPADISVRLRLGELYVKSGRKEDAIKEYGEVAKVNAQKGFYLKAIAVYKQIMKLDESNLDVHYKLADLYARQRLIVDAIGEYSHILGVFEKKGRNVDCLDLLKKMADIDRENVGLKLKLADTHKKLGYMDDALDEYLWVSRRFLGQGKTDKAEKILSELYPSYPGDLRLLDCLMEFYRVKGERFHFLKYARELLGVSVGKGDREKAKAVAKAILELEPHDEKAREFTREAGELAEPEKPAEIKAEAGPQPIWLRTEAVAAPVEEEETIELVVEPMEEEIEVLEPVEMIEEAVEEAAGHPSSLTGGIPRFEIPAEEEEAVEDGVPAGYGEALPQGGFPSEAASVETEAGITEEETAAAGEAVEKAAESIEGQEEEEKGEEDFVDLSRELGMEEAVEKLIGPWSKDSTIETVEEIRAGIGKQLFREDVETHHNMGIAYMEMGLYDDAIREFKISAQDASFELEAYTRSGLCSKASGSTGDAISYYLKALKAGGRSDEERKGLMYELALAYDEAGNQSEAMEIFRSIHETDPEYREVADRVEAALSEEEPRGIPKGDDMMEVELL